MNNTPKNAFKIRMKEQSIASIRAKRCTLAAKIYTKECELTSLRSIPLYKRGVLVVFVTTGVNGPSEFTGLVKSSTPGPHCHLYDIICPEYFKRRGYVSAHMVFHDLKETAIKSAVKGSESILDIIKAARNHQLTFLPL